MHAHILLALLFVVLISPAASAQWLKLPSEGIPRMADGRPDLAAPAVRTADGRPDFSGIWTWTQDPTCSTWRGI